VKRSITPILLLSITISVLAEPIRLHPDNPHYFLYNNRPTVLITSGEHYGAVLNRDFDYNIYLETLQKDGLNLTRLFSGAYVEKQGAFGIRHNSLAPAQGRYLPPWNRSGEPGYAGGGEKFDLDKWNPEYFDRLKDFIRTAGRNDVVVELVFFSSTYAETNWSFHPFNPENNVNDTRFEEWKKLNTKDNGVILKYQEELVRKLVLELDEFDNLFFEIQNEPWADNPDSAGVLLGHITPDQMSSRGAFWENRVSLANPASLEWQKHLAAIVREEESTMPKKHLIAQNYCNFRWPVADVDDHIDILNFHYAYPEAVLWNWGWDRPISYDESGFAGDAADDYRRLVWRFMLSGGAVFNGLDYSFYPGSEDGQGANKAGGVSDPEFRTQLGVLKQFLDTVDLVSMRPDRHTVVHAPQCVISMMSDPGNWAVAYLEGRAPTRLKLDLPQGLYSLRWLDPKTGGEVSDERIRHSGGAAVVKTPDFDAEVVLEIKKQVIGKSHIAAGTGMLAAAAKTNITPPVGFRRGGNFHEMITTGVRDSLFAKALVFKQGGVSCALVFCDITSISRDVAKKARQIAANKTGIPFEHILISATHAHTAPLYYGIRRNLFHEQAVKKNNGIDPHESSTGLSTRSPVRHPGYSPLNYFQALPGRPASPFTADFI